MAHHGSHHPGWWSGDHDSAWDRVKAAFRRDWEQTKHDFGGDEPDLKQDADDTIKQMVGADPVPPGNQPEYDYDHFEPAYRFGYGARMQYGNRFNDWNDDLDTQLHSDWDAAYGHSDGDWDRFRSHVRRGWDYYSSSGMDRRAA